MNSDQTQIKRALRNHFAEVREFDGETSAMDDVYRVGSASNALLYSLLFMPPLIEIHGCVLLESSIDDSTMRERFNVKRFQSDTDLAELERSFNFTEIGYIFDVEGRDTSDEEDELLAKRIADCWRGWLHVCYPNRSFDVRVVDAEEAGSTVAVDFSEVRLRKPDVGQKSATLKPARRPRSSPPPDSESP